MKNNFAGKIGISIVTIVIAAASSLSISAQLTSSKDQGVNRIVGAWETLVQPRNCDTGEPIGQPFPGVITFNEGGTVAEYGANPATPFRTPGHGFWSSEGRGIYKLRFSFIPLTPQGVPIGRIRVSQIGEVPRFSNEQHSTGSFELTNFAGVVIGSGCSSAIAVRLD
ncbi:MAG: hypothetical protein AB7V18_12030 [Pyrinomonadaceae bacterium]